MRNMKWEDINGADQWHFTIGKTKVPHVVPLSHAAQAPPRPVPARLVPTSLGGGPCG